MAKVYTVRTYRNGRQTDTSGTMEELIEYFGYTLECGRSYEHEKGNKKINANPKSGKSLVTNLNNATNNAAANGCSSTSYSLVE